MSTHENDQTTRRGFLGTIATGAAAMSLAGIASPLQQLHASPGSAFTVAEDPAEQIFKNLKGKHRAIFDVVAPHPEILLPFAWPRVFLVSNEATGTPTKDNNVIVVLRHHGIAYAFEDRLWSKYNFGEMFHAMDPETQKAATKNNFWKPATPYAIPGIGPVPIAINDLQDSGVQFVVCNVAMQVYSAVLADKMKMKQEDVYNDFKAGLLPGVTPVPSGVWAVGRAQENRCAYFYAS
jgi:intracellular sulfur oxidation DsrE/DsrF family protein